MRKRFYLTRLRFLWMILSLAVGASLILAACGGGTAANPTPTTAPPTPTATPSPTPTPVVVQVKIVEKNDKYTFDPAALTIKVGTQVEWVNMSDAPHTVTPDTAGAFTGTTSNIQMGANFMTTFTTAGTFPYHCNIHLYMKATITVTS